MTNRLQVHIPQACEECGRQGVANHSQCWFEGMDEPCTSESFSCSHCGAAWEVDGTGLTDEERSLFYTQFGVWELKLDSSGSASIELARKLQHVLKIDGREALSILRGNKSDCFRGTRVEVEWMRGRLRANGLLTAIAQVAPPAEKEQP